VLRTHSIDESPGAGFKRQNQCKTEVAKSPSWFSKMAHLESFFICPKESMTTFQHIKKTSFHAKQQLAANHPPHPPQQHGWLPFQPFLSGLTCQLRVQ